jgi:hypothetical protein
LSSPYYTWKRALAFAALPFHVMSRPVVVAIACPAVAGILDECKLILWLTAEKTRIINKVSRIPLSHKPHKLRNTNETSSLIPLAHTIIDAINNPQLVRS